MSLACAFVNTQVSNALIDYIDQYNVIGDVCLSSVQSQIDMLYHPIRSRLQILSSLHSKSDALSQQVKFTHYVKTHVMCDHYSPFSLWRYQFTSTPQTPSLLTQEAKEKECADENTNKYLNKKDVQKALHAQLVGIDKWSFMQQVMICIVFKNSID